MKFRFEKSNDKEEIVAYAKEKNKLIEAIEALCINEANTILAYDDNKIIELSYNDVDCFITINDKIYAVVENKKLIVKKRLYELDSLTGDSFIFINQNCLANINKIKYFEASIGGALLIVFKSGYKDYVSRRKLKYVKERLGLK